tara:strand:- start:30 stop:815 length:786 start_codon:yes stop_codon:yes gene_type:complete
MAQYSNYKKVSGASLPAGSVTADKVGTVGLNTWNVKWFWGSPNACTPGCCCLWTVPSGVRRMTIEMWGAGGSGSGSCNCSRCLVFRGAQGGYYNTKTIDVQEGWQYTVCAAGVYRCCYRNCVGCCGCASYVNGCNLSNFCAIGGHGGIHCNSWTLNCHSENMCCRAPGNNGGDFGMGNHMGGYWNPKGYFCHCHGSVSNPTAAPFIGTGVMQQLNFCWIRCGCWTVPFGHGGQNGMTTYCGSGHCGQGGMGGAGLVKITYV